MISLSEPQQQLDCQVVNYLYINYELNLVIKNHSALTYYYYKHTIS